MSTWLQGENLFAQRSLTPIILRLKSLTYYFRHGHFSFQVDLGNIIAIHGIGTQGHGAKEAWVSKFKVQISLDAINFVTLMDTESDKELVSILNC